MSFVQINRILIKCFEIIPKNIFKYLKKNDIPYYELYLMKYNFF